MCFCGACESLVLFIFLERERKEWNWGGREDLGGVGKWKSCDQNILYENNSFSIEHFSNIVLELQLGSFLNSFTDETKNLENGISIFLYHEVSLRFQSDFADE